MDWEPYRPAVPVLQRLAAVDLVAVVGPSAAGKTTVVQEAVRREPTLQLVRSNTSRVRRPGECDGVDYRFCTRERMLERIRCGEYVQVAPNAFGDLYATAAEDYAGGGVALLPVLAEAVPEFRVLPFADVRVVYILPPDAATWQDRLAERGWDDGTRARRLAEARRSLRLGLDDPDSQFVINDSLGTAVDDFVTIVARRPWPARLYAEQVRGRGVAADLLASADRFDATVASG